MSQSPSNTTLNPLLDGDFAFPFDRIQPEHVVSGLRQHLTHAQAALEAIKASQGVRTWDNSLGALDAATEPLETAYNVVSHLRSVCHTDALAEAHTTMVPEVSRFFSAIALDADLYAAVKAYADTPEAKALTGPRKRYLDKTLRDFVRSGAELAPDDKAALAGLDAQMAELGNAFGQAVLDATAAWERVITDEARLAGLPDSAMGMLRDAAKAKDLDGWRITLQAPTVIAVTQYADDRALRQEVWQAYNRRAADTNPERITTMLSLRRQKAKLLGFDDFADYVLQERMAGSGAKARSFVAELAARSQDAFHRETAELSQFAAGLGLAPLQPWDVSYVSEKLRVARFDLNEEALRPYFAFEQVRDGMFALVQRLYGITVQPTDLPVWHPDVRTYAVHDADGHHLGSFYADFFPREAKRGGAWMNAFRTGAPLANGRLAPHLGLICGNVTPPTADGPSLLTHREVETLFHEFGHLLHHLLTEVPVRGLAGTNVAWDFVELPSQIMENWCWEREALNLFATHHQTGAVIPDDLFDRMIAARTFRSASAMMRQLGFGTVDLALHSADGPGDTPVLHWARAKMAPFAAVAPPTDYAMIASFGHLFSSPTGYAAGYYSYKWAEVLDADAFSRFSERGVFHAETGNAFRRTVLAGGDAQAPEDLFRAFMGREPDPEALLRRAGLA